MGYSPYGHKELDTTEGLSVHMGACTHTHTQSQYCAHVLEDFKIWGDNTQGMQDCSSPTSDHTLNSCLGNTVLTTGPPGKSCFVGFIFYLFLLTDHSAHAEQASD